MSTKTSTTPTTTFPGPDDACPAWCTTRETGNAGIHSWEFDDGKWSRMHQHNVGLFSVMQFENVTADGRTFDAPSGDTCLDTFDTAKDAREIAADLETVARLMDQIEAAR